MQRSEMKLYVGLSSSYERNECACEDWERKKQKRTVIFHICPYSWFQVGAGMEHVKATGKAQRNKVNDWRETA